VWDEKPFDVTLLDEDFAANDPLLLLLALTARTSSPPPGWLAPPRVA
jgi:hypothetical protein